MHLRIVETEQVDGKKTYTVERKVSDKTGWGDAVMLKFDSLRAARRWIEKKEGREVKSKRVVWP